MWETLQQHRNSRHLLLCTSSRLAHFSQHILTQVPGRQGGATAAMSQGSKPRLPGLRTSLRAQLVKNLPAMRETWVQSLGWEDLLEKGKATHPSILAWRIPWTVHFMGLQRVGHN